MEKGLLFAIIQMLFITAAAIIIGSEYSFKEGIAVALFGWATMPYYKENQ